MSARRLALAADIRHEVAAVLNQIRYLRTRTDDVSAYALPLARNRLAHLIADHRVIAAGAAS